METVEELLKKYRDGDEWALEELFKQFKPIINRTVRKFFLVGGELEDLMQEGMIGLYRAIISFDFASDAKFLTYSRVCIERNVINAIKSASSKKNLPLNAFMSLSDHKDDDDDDDVSQFIAYDEQNPESILLNKEKYSKLFELATQNLSNFEINVLKLYLDGLSYGEIAEKLDKSTKSVDNGLTRIKAKISQLQITEGV